MTLLSGCHHYGILVKRESELNCPTDIRKTVPWCAGEDAIFKCPCGPNEQFHGHKPTSWRLWQTSGAEWRDMHCQPIGAQRGVAIPEGFAVEQIPLPRKSTNDTLMPSDADSELTEPEADEVAVVTDAEEDDIDIEETDLEEIEEADPEVTDETGSDETNSSDEGESLPEPSEEEPKQLENPTDTSSSQTHPQLPWEEEEEIVTTLELVEFPSESSVMNALHLFHQPENYLTAPERLDESISLTNPSRQVVFHEPAKPLKLFPPVEPTEPNTFQQVVPLQVVPLFEESPRRVESSELQSEQVDDSDELQLGEIASLAARAESMNDVTAMLADTKSSEQPFVALQALVEQPTLMSEPPLHPKSEVNQTATPQEAPTLQAMPAKSSLSVVKTPERKASKNGPLRFLAKKAPSSESAKSRNPASMFVR